MLGCSDSGQLIPELFHLNYRQRTKLTHRIKDIFSFLSKVEKYTFLSQWTREKQTTGDLMATVGITTPEWICQEQTRNRQRPTFILKLKLGSTKNSENMFFSR